MRPGRDGHHGGRRAFLYFERAQTRFALPEVLLEGGECRSDLVDGGGDVGGICDKHVVVLPMLGVGEFSDISGRLGLRLLEAALDILEGDP